MKFEDLKQLPRRNEVELGPRVKTIAYCCENAFLLKHEISTVIFGVKSGMRTIDVHKAEEFEHKRRTLENIIQIAQKERDAYSARLDKRIVTREVLYASSCKGEDEDDALLLFGNGRGHSLQGISERVVQPSRIPSATNDYRQDHPGWIDRPLRNEKSSVSRDLVCRQV